MDKLPNLSKSHADGDRHTRFNWYGFFLETSKIHIFIELEPESKEKSPADTQESLVLRRCPRKQLQTNMVRVYLQISSLFNLYHHINFQLAPPIIEISTINLDIPSSQCMVALAWRSIRHSVRCGSFQSHSFQACIFVL